MAFFGLTLPTPTPTTPTTPERTATPEALSLEAQGYEAWLRALFPEHITAPFADRHHELWSWAWSIRRNRKPDPFVAGWPRGGGKSSSAELACVALGARDVRRYGWYVSSTQDQADDHVANVAALLERDTIARLYPDMAERAIGKYGHSKGWRRNRVRTKAGYTLDAVGLDQMRRGAKLEDARPDHMIFDDIDDHADSLATVTKKIRIITERLLRAGTNDTAVLVAQNLMHADSIVAQLVDGRAGFLVHRIVSGPHPAVLDLVTAKQILPNGMFRDVITSGTPTWQGQDLAACQAAIDESGLVAFLRESQHDIETGNDGLYTDVVFRHCDWQDVPWGQILKTVCWVDPTVTETDKSDNCGIQIDALATDGTIYRLWSWEQRANPYDALTIAVRMAVAHRAECVGVETDQGGDLWASAYRQVVHDLRRHNERMPVPQYRYEKASHLQQSKTARSSDMLVDYQAGRIVHVIGPIPMAQAAAASVPGAKGESTHAILERALRRFPTRKPYDLVDAAYYSWRDLRKGWTASDFRPIRVEFG